MWENVIKIKGAKLHNLKNGSVDIPIEKFVVITGVSGSGKSSLTMDTLFAEGLAVILRTKCTMKLKFLVILYLIFISNHIFSQQTINLILNKDIKAKCVQNFDTISTTEFSIDTIYQTTFKVKKIVEDTIDFNYLDNNSLKKSFTCYHFYENDTLVIKGGFGFGQMYGFVAKIYPDKKAVVKLKLQWNYPSYFNNVEEKFAKNYIDVDSKQSELILNKLPKNKNDRSHLYGYVEFISNDYYVEMIDEKTNLNYKQKSSSEYKIYFDSRYLMETK